MNTGAPRHLSWGQISALVTRAADYTILSLAQQARKGDIAVRGSMV